MRDILNIGIVCPADWVALPLGSADDVLGWAGTTADELRVRSGEAGYDLDAVAARHDLRERAADSRGRAPLFAGALYPDGFDAALATLEVDSIHPDASVPRISLDWLAATFSAADFGPPHITRVELPMGAAVRIRQNFAAAADAEQNPGILLETLVYGVLPEGTDSAIVMLLSWTVPGMSEVLERMADAVANALTVEI
ncbi:hypothetical protein [Streptomyces sp. A5-4]|uniref:hypothetical protein n=1 Tax=Streptomyces sp. A5-4 TaxID=3384771 RepID=UPI003DA89D0A